MSTHAPRPLTIQLALILLPLCSLVPLANAQTPVPKVPKRLAASASSTDCAQSFARDNRLKPEAGAYRVNMEALVPAKHSRVVEIVPPGSMRLIMQISSASGPSSESIIIGDKSWSRQDGQWVPVDVLKSHTAFTTYDDLSGQRQNVVCAVEGADKTVRGYTYNYASGGGTLVINMQFDARTGHPLSMTTNDAQGRTLVKARYTFDQAIRIEAPDKR